MYFFPGKNPKYTLNNMKYVVLVLILFLTSFNVGYVFAESQIDINKLTSEQLEKLPKEKLNKLPFIDLMMKLMEKEAKDPKKLAILLLEINLNTLKFYNQIPTGMENPNLENAIKNFQKSINKNPSGILTMEEFSILKEHLNAVSPKKIIALSSDPKIFVIQDNYAHVTGTWKGEYEFPIQLSDITCRKDNKTCTEATAFIMEKPLTKSDSEDLALQIYYYTITQWDDNSITAEKSWKCSIYTLMLNSKTNEVYRVERNNTADDCKLGAGITIPKLQHPIIVKLVNGIDNSFEYYKKINEERAKYYNQEFMNKVKSIILNSEKGSN